MGVDSVMFEYKVIGVPTSSSPAAIQDALNGQALHGWELDKIDPHQDTQHPNRFFVLKRARIEVRSEEGEEALGDNQKAFSNRDGKCPI
jgi:hypothetical protein